MVDNEKLKILSLIKVPESMQGLIVRELQNGCYLDYLDSFLYDQDNAHLAICNEAYKSSFHVSGIPGKHQWLQS